MYAIEFNNVWKKFKKGDKAIALRDVIPQLFKKLFIKQPPVDLKNQEFWAVKNVNFKVEKGEVLGIIGPNGAGKSTILKLLSQIMCTTKGECKVNGRLSALIEVTAGFHPDFTGRENVYFNGSIFGMSKQEIESKFEQIVDFSGIRDFIDTPVKRYSSGMQARLGFAIAAHVDPDVLLVDEVLSVGDKTFQAKCMQKMRELLDSGVTIIFISHNIQLVQKLCKRIILLHKGEVLHDGVPEEVVPHYDNLIHQMREEEVKQQLATAEGNVATSEESIVHITDIKILDNQGQATEKFSSSDDISIEISYESFGRIDNPVFTFEVLRSDRVVCCNSTSRDEGFAIEYIDGKGKVVIKLNKTWLSSGVYYINAGIWDSDQIHPYEIVKRGVFTIKSDSLNSHIYAVYKVCTDWNHESDK